MRTGALLAILLLAAACGGGEDAASVCGDGVLGAGEECDDGGFDDGDGCSAVCLLEYCGNGVVDPDERCDDGNVDPADGCGPGCGEEECGNGVVDVGTGEECDDANLEVDDGCSPACRLERCGNGVLDPGEVCDDGNLDDGDACRADCTPVPACGTFANAGFTTTDDWVTHEAFIATTATGAATPGELVFDGEAACSDPFAYQTICVPPYEVAGLQAIAAHIGRFATGGPLVQPALSIGLTSPQKLPYAYDGYREQHLCLGEAGYGNGITVTASVIGCDDEVDFAFDDLSVRPATVEECAVPGTVRNGDFEVDGFGWQSLGSGLREIIDDGTGNHVVHVRAAAATCETPFFVGSFSPPSTSIAPPIALELTVRGNAPVHVFTREDAVAFEDVSAPATATATTVRLCVDDANLGRTFSAAIGFTHPGVCTTAPAREAWIDDLHYVHAPECR